MTTVSYQNAIADAMKQLVADSTAFQTWRAAHSSAEAAYATYSHAIDGDANEAFPFVRVDTILTTGRFVTGGTLKLTFYGGYRCDWTAEENIREFLNHVGNTVRQIFNLSRSGNGAYLHLQAVPEPIDDPVLPSDAESADDQFIDQTYEVRFGLSEGA